MSDFAEIKALVEKQIQEGVRASQRNDDAERRHEASQQSCEDLLAEIRRMREAAAAAAAIPAEGVAPVHAPMDGAARAAALAAARVEKISKMGIYLRKSTKV